MILYSQVFIVRSPSRCYAVEARSVYQLATTLAGLSGLEKIGAVTPSVILSREDGEGSQNAKVPHFEILRFAQDDKRLRSERAAGSIFTAPQRTVIPSVARDLGGRWLEDH